MAFDTKTFFTRLGSAIVFSIIMMLAFLTHTLSFMGLFFLVNILCLREYAGIVEKILGIPFTRNEKMNFYLVGIAAFLLVCSIEMGCADATAEKMNTLLFYFLGLCIGAAITFFIFRKNRKSVYLLTGVGYISVSLGLLVQMRYQSLLLPLILLLLIWMNDTMAYLTGSFFGRTKFFPAISPKKTLEGTIGGLLFAMAFAALWGYYTEWFPLYQWIILGAIASVVGTAGDLAESKLKRMAGIKDSGQMMPGHGGALDRFDSLLLAAPIAFLFAMVCMRCFPYEVF